MLTLVTSVIAFFSIARILLFHLHVEGWSMYPTYQPGDHLLALRYFPQRWLRRGQIVVWKLPSDPLMHSMSVSMDSKLYIKRIIGLPGDDVFAPIVKFPDGQEGKKQRTQEQDLQKWHIPARHCFVKGDSPSYDSTFFGPLPLHALRGVILAKLPRRMKTVEEPYFVDSISPPPQKNP